MCGWRRIACVMCLTVGCQSSTKAPYADNPLLMSREPLKQNTAVNKSYTSPNISQSMPTEAPPATVTRTPPVQTTSWVKPAASTDVAPPYNQIIATSAQVPQRVSATPRLPEPLDPPPAVVLPKPPAPSPSPVIAPALPVSDRPVVRYGHSPDYAWLVGEIDVHYRGHKELRFCPISEENSIGGKVRLVDDPQLADLKAGTLVRIEGELVQNDPTAVAGEYPRYHIRSIQIIEKPAK
jgi:hypothetical protein